MNKALVRILALSLCVVVPAQALANDDGTSGPDFEVWSVDGVHEALGWDQPFEAVTERSADHFANVWTTRFLDEQGLQAYLDSPGLYEDGYNDLSESDKKALIDHLIRHWETTFPDFTDTFYVGSLAADVEALKELAFITYMVIFDKDEFFASLREPFERAAYEDVPDGPVDAGIEAFPGMSQEQIDAHLEAIREVHQEITPEPALEELTVSDPTGATSVVDGVAPTPAEALAEIVSLPELEAATTELPALPAAREVDTSGPESRWDPGEPRRDTPIQPPREDLGDLLQDLLDLLENVVPPVSVALAPPEPGELLNAVAQGTYLACGQMADGNVTCAPAPVPLGTPVPLDLDGDPLTGVAGAEVIVDLTPFVHPGYLTDVTARLQVVRTVAQEVLPSPLPASVFVVYNVAQAGTQVMAGFDGRMDTLAQSQSAQVTLVDAPLALAGDVNLHLEVEHTPGGNNSAVLAGVSSYNASSFPPVPEDPTVASLLFDPAPDMLTADLRFAEEFGKGIIEASTNTTQLTNVTAAITIDRGDSRHEMLGVIEPLPREVHMRAETEAAGATHLAYRADTGFDRFLFQDQYWPDHNNSQEEYTLLAAEVLDIPDAITFDIGHPFDVTYSASDRVGHVGVAIEEYDAEGLVTAMRGSADGIPTNWALDMESDPVRVGYTADQVLDGIGMELIDREEKLQMLASVQDLPTQVDIDYEDDHIVFDANAPIGPIATWLSKGGLTPTVLAGEHASVDQSGDALAASALIDGLSHFELDTRDATHGIVTFDIAGGEPFALHANTDQGYLDALLSNLPTSVRVDWTDDDVRYQAAQPIDQFDAHAELQGMIAQLSVDDIPTDILVAWTDTSLSYDALDGATVTQVQALIQDGDLVAGAVVDSIPPSWDLSWAGNTYVFDAPATVGSVLAWARLNGGSPIFRSGDFASVNQQGSAIGVAGRLSGIQHVSVDTNDGGHYLLELSPGGQPFFAEGHLDDFHAFASISQLPQSIEVDLSQTAGSFSYQASSAIDQIWAVANDQGTGALSVLQLLQLPATVDVLWDIGQGVEATYDASAPIDKISAFHRDAAGAAYQLVVTSIPRHLLVRADAGDVLFEARDGASAPIGSASIGNILARYGSDGSFFGVPARDHAFYTNMGGVERASLGYSGLERIDMDMGPSGMVLDIRNSAPRLFDLYFESADVRATGTVDRVPAHITATMSDAWVTYNAHGTTIDSIVVTYTNKVDVTANVQVLGIPDFIGVNLNMPTIRYFASAPIDEINVNAWIDDWFATVQLDQVPDDWVVTINDGGQFKFDAFGKAIGQLRAIVTNHGGYQAYAGNHLVANFREASGNLDASLLLNQVQKVEYRKLSSSNYIDLRAGGGQLFRLQGDAEFANGDIAYLFAQLNPLPSSIQGSFGDHTTISTNTNFDLLTYAEFGNGNAVANTPSPPLWHGASVRDGASGSNTGIKARVYLTGLPTFVHVNPDSAGFIMNNFRPTFSSNVVLDAELKHVVSQDADVFVVLSNLPKSLSVNFDMDSQVISGNRKQIDVDLVTSASIGSLWAEAKLGNNVGRISVSNIPDDIHALMTLGSGSSSFVWDASAPISNIWVGFRVLGSSSFQGYVSITDLPSDFSITYGQNDKGPTLTYNANANTLDINAFVDASLFGGNVRAEVFFVLTNLAKDTDVWVSGDNLRIRSNPVATDLFYARVYADVSYFKSGSGTWGSGTVSFPWAYHVGVYPDIDRFAVVLDDPRDFTLKWGATSKVSGTYKTFSFGWANFDVFLDLFGQIKAKIDWPWPFGSSTITIVSAHIHKTINVNVLFHKYNNHRGWWFGFSGSFICDFWANFDLRPHPHGASWNGASFSSSTATGGAWYFTPNPWGILPSWAVDVGTRYLSPDGGGVWWNWGIDC